MTSDHLPTVREYHVRTKLSPGVVASRRVDAALIPRQYKRYVDSPTVELPPPAASGLSMFDLEGQTDAPPRALTLPVLAAVLHYSAGIVRRRSVGGRGVAFRAASCTGALYHIELHVVCGDLDGLSAGVYHFDVPSGSLRRLRQGDFRRALSTVCCDEGPAAAAASVVLTSTFWRNAWRYEERAYRHVFWDAGTLLANLLAVAEAHGLRPALRSAFVDDDVNALFGVDGRREVAVAVVALGQGRTAGPAPEVVPLDVGTEPPSRAAIEYPLIWQTHAATSLPDCEAVQAWRSRAKGSAAPRQRFDDLDAGAPTLEATIERRGSARRFSDAPLALGDFELLLAAATGSPANDHALANAALRRYAIVNAVEGIEAGAYAVGGTGELELIALGDQRARASELALGQRAAGRAAVNLYFVASLSELTAALGGRGYRAAQIEAGIRTGQVYLAATALGLKATGLTFYDDEVARLFGLDAEDAAVLMLVAFGS